MITQVEGKLSDLMQSQGEGIEVTHHTNPVCTLYDARNVMQVCY